MKTNKFSLKYFPLLLVALVINSFTSIDTPNNTLKNQIFRVDGNAFEKIGRESYTLTIFKKK